jgi:predicted nucleic acid-binding protein
VRERIQDWLTDMTRFVIDAGVGLYLVTEGIEVNPKHELLAPTLFRSQTLSLAHESVARGELPATVAIEQLEQLWQLKIRLLGDAVLRRLAWKIADRLQWASTYDAEYIALTQLQGDAFVTLDPDLARRVEGIVAIATVNDLR